jgi:hypothetical protein
MAKNIPAFSIPSLSKIYPSLDIWYENTYTIWQPRVAVAKSEKCFYIEADSADATFPKLRETGEQKQGDRIGRIFAYVLGDCLLREFIKVYRSSLNFLTKSFHGRSSI